MGPGGAWGPDLEADVHLLVGDESAAPAIAATLEALPGDTRAEVFLEVADPDSHLPLPGGAAVTVTWVHRSDAGDSYGQALSRAVRASGVPAGTLCAFATATPTWSRTCDASSSSSRACRARRSRSPATGAPATTRTRGRRASGQAGKRTFVEQMEQEETELTGWPELVELSEIC